MKPIVFIRDLTVSFGRKVILDRISLDLHPGEIYALMGTNGAGKSTLLRTIAGLVHPATGSVEISGAAGYVAQAFGLYNDLRVEENITFHARCHGLTGSPLRTRVDECIHRFDLSSKRREITRTLSHGWKQRVALAASLAHRPAVLLLDEATAGIDPVAREQLWKILLECAQSGMAILLATHHLEEAERSHRVGYLAEGSMAVCGGPRDLILRGRALLQQPEVSLAAAIAAILLQERVI